MVYLFFYNIFMCDELIKSIDYKSISNNAYTLIEDYDEKNNIIIYPSKKYNLIKWIIGHIKKPLSYKKLFYFIKENGIFSIFNIIKQRYF